MHIFSIQPNLGIWRFHLSGGLGLTLGGGEWRDPTWWHPSLVNLSGRRVCNLTLTESLSVGFRVRLFGLQLRIDLGYAL